MKSFVLVLASLAIICQVQGAYKFICHLCAKNNAMVGFENEDEFLQHTDNHTQKDIFDQNQLVEDAKAQDAIDAAAPKLFHCHHCQFVQSFNSSSEFINHVDTEHKQPTVEDNTEWLPQGKLKMKGAAAAPVADLNNVFAGNEGFAGQNNPFGGGQMFDGMAR